MSVIKKTYLFLAIGLVAASQSGNLVRLGDASPVAISAWRLLLASVMLAPLAGSNLATLKKLRWNDVLLLTIAGVVMAAHFFTWIAAVQLTTVASAALFFASNPVLTAVAAHLFYGERITKKLAISIALGLFGVIVIGSGDWRHQAAEELMASPPAQSVATATTASAGTDGTEARGLLDRAGDRFGRRLVGDMLALICSAMFTVYFLLGKRLRQKLPTSAYVTALYGTAAITGFAVMAAMKLPFFDYNNRTWLCFLLMALIPTMIGHTSMNNALRYIDASRLSVATLSEPLMAGLVAAVAWDEAITLPMVIGYAFIIGSVLVLISERRSS